MATITEASKFKSVQGFDSVKQENIYFKFVVRVIELLQAEILVRRLGTAEDFDNDSWEKKILKIFKALSIMEQHKTCEPVISKSFSELNQHIIEKRRQNKCDVRSMQKSEQSRFSIHDLSQIQAIDSICNTKLFLTDSILTGKEIVQNAPKDGIASGCVDYDPLYVESAVFHNNRGTFTSFEIADVITSNSKPLLVSELVSSYKGMNTSLLSEPSVGAD